MKTVHHLEVDTQVLLGEVIQHACIHQALHEVTAVLGEPQAGQPFISNPFVIHISVGQGLGTREGRGHGGGGRQAVPTGYRQHIYWGETPVTPPPMREVKLANDASAYLY